MNNLNVGGLYSILLCVKIDRDKNSRNLCNNCYSHFFLYFCYLKRIFDVNGIIMYDNNQNNGDRLFESIRQGDIGAYEMLFKKYYLSMCMIARRIVEDEDVAKDLVQEIFIRLWEKRETYDFRETADIFLYVSVRNKCFDYLRSRKNLPLQEGLSAAGNEYFFRDILIEEETYRIVMEAIDALPAQSGRIIKLSLEGKQNKEISENLGISVNTVKSLKYKAMDALREVLKDYFYLLLVFLAENN